MNGAGAAGIAIAKHLLNMGVKDITLCDSKGIICKGDPRLNAVKQEMAEITNLSHIEGTVRASFAMYNTKAEVDALVAGIERVSRMF